MANNNIKNKDTSSQFSEKYRKLHIRPWARLFARYTDLSVFGFLFGIIAGRYYPSLRSDTYIANSLLIIFLWVLIEPFFLSSCGTTLGKFLFNIKVTDLNGYKLNIFTSFKRSLGVWIVGLGFGIPIISLFTLILAKSRLNKTGTTYWDKDNFIVTHGDIGYVRRTTIAFLLMFLIVVIIYVNYKNSQFLSPTNYATEVEKENKELPKMVDSETQLYKIYFESNTLTYEFRLINMESANVNKTTLYNLKDKIIKTACDKSSPNPTLALGYNISLNYMDKNGVSITNILVKPSDCK